VENIPIAILLNHCAEKFHTRIDCLHTRRNVAHDHISTPLTHDLMRMDLLKLHYCAIYLYLMNFDALDNVRDLKLRTHGLEILESYPQNTEPCNIPCSGAVM
jgi:hypothetical protein